MSSLSFLYLFPLSSDSSLFLPPLSTYLPSFILPSFPSLSRAALSIRFNLFRLGFITVSFVWPDKPQFHPGPVSAYKYVRGEAVQATGSIRQRSE